VARPSFVVQHLIFCTGVSYPDVRRPQRNSTLDGVDFVLQMPPNAEFPFEPAEFWLYARVYSTSDDVGDSAPLSVTCVWLDSPDGQEPEVWTHPLGRIAFHKPRATLDRGWAFRSVEGVSSFPFPGVGRYVFRLWTPTRKWPMKREKAEEFISLEVVP
jgi:hypothetical protein